MKTLDDIKREAFCELMRTQHWHGKERLDAEHYIGLTIDRLHAQGLLMVWQPIETAPKDGTVVDLAEYDYKYGYLRRMHDCRYCVPKHNPQFENPTAQWCVPRIDHFSYGEPIKIPSSFKPTHWMPLPPIEMSHR